MPVSSDNTRRTNPFGPPRFFPDPLTVDDVSGIGVVAIGLPLHREVLRDAYTHGIFPWPSCGFVPWCSPNPRTILPLDGAHWSRRLMRRVHSGRFEVTFDRAFDAVIEACATTGNRPNEMWITPEMRHAYIDLHESGIAHSVETWHDGRLVGGVYGVAIRGLFAGESMFYYETDASKVALYHLVEHLRFRGYGLFDIQMTTAHTARLGAREITKAEYIARLHDALRLNISFNGTAKAADRSTTAEFD